MRDQPAPMNAIDAAPDARLSVLVVNSLYPPQAVGGAEAVTQMLATSLARQGHRATVVTSCSKADGELREHTDGVDIHRFFPPNLWWLNDRFAGADERSRIAKLGWRLFDGWNIAAARRFGRILEEVRPDVVHTHNIKGFSPALWHEVARRAIPLVHTAHSYELICARGSLLDKRHRVCRPEARCSPCWLQGQWYGAHARAISVFCSPSRYLLDAHRRAGLRFVRSAVVRNGYAGPAERRPARDGEPGELRLLYLGQLAPHKGIATLLDAVRRCPANIRLDIAGQGPAVEAVQHLARIDARVHYHGFIGGAEKRALLERADALIFPSIWVENAPMAIIEALCHGVPVIASDIGAAPEFVADGMSGLLVPPGDPAALADAMTSLAGDEPRLRQLGHGAARAGRAMPGPDEMTASYVDIYRSLVRRLESAPDRIAQGSRPISVMQAYGGPR